MKWCSVDNYLEHSIFNVPFNVDENGLKFAKKKLKQLVRKQVFKIVFKKYLRFNNFIVIQLFFISFYI